MIDQVGPFLQAQIRYGDDIKSLADGLARSTSEVRHADPQVRALLAVVQGAADEASTAFSGIGPTFPVLTPSLANLARVGVIYHKSIEQLLVVLPRAVRRDHHGGGRRTSRRGRRAGLQDRLWRPAAL